VLHLVAQKPIIQIARFMPCGDFGMTVLLVKYVSRQFYIDLMTGNFQVFEMAPRDVIGVLSVLVIHVAGVRRHAGNHSVGGYHVKDV
jgi:hypothetical protein